jgi:hypothetical protein
MKIIKKNIKTRTKKNSQEVKIKEAKKQIKRKSTKK